MRWKKGRRSRNVEGRRGQRVGRGLKKVSEQRATWLRRGLQTGSVEARDTFGS